MNGSFVVFIIFYIVSICAATRRIFLASIALIFPSSFTSPIVNSKPSAVSSCAAILRAILASEALILPSRFISPLRIVTDGAVVDSSDGLPIGTVVVTAGIVVVAGGIVVVTVVVSVTFSLTFTLKMVVLPLYVTVMVCIPVFVKAVGLQVKPDVIDLTELSLYFAVSVSPDVLRVSPT